MEHTLCIDLQTCLPAARTQSDRIEGGHPLDNVYLDTYHKIYANQLRQCMPALPFGVLNQTAWIPTHVLAIGRIIQLDTGDANAAFLQSNTDWQITDVALLDNVHDIDSSFAKPHPTDM